MDVVTMAHLVITDQNFQQEILADKGVSVVDFWAPWCGPCKIVGPIIEEIAKDYAGKVKIGKLDVDENPETAGQFNIMSIPTVVFFKEGKPVHSMVGAQSKESYKKAIEDLLK
jgi:thioredoxin 1